MAGDPVVIDLGRMEYAAAYERQNALIEDLIASRGGGLGSRIGTVLLVEHPPVITVTRRPGAADHLLASREWLAGAGIEVRETDRGGDITYHGPGQLVVYPIVDLNRLNLGLHEYMRLLEEAVIRTLGAFGVVSRRDPGATGVWVDSDQADPARAAKVCAMGVRVRRWATLHGLAINVTTDLAHFSYIVPCGLAGRPVTSLGAILGPECPTMETVKAELAARLSELLREAAANADAVRASVRS
jgi:lipoyl(octanoyl) transferase